MYATSVSEAEQLSEMMPDCPQILRHLAAARLGAGDRAGALADVVRAGRRDPYCRRLLWFFSNILTGDREENAKLVGSAAEKLPLAAGDRVTVHPRSVLVLRGTSPASDATTTTAAHRPAGRVSEAAARG